MSFTAPSAAEKQLEGGIPPLKTYSAASILKMEFEPTIFSVDDLVPAGLTLLCGGSKIGKSWFVLSMCCSVATGRPFLGRETTPGSVLYLALEDTMYRIRSRLETLGEAEPEQLCVTTESRTLNEGLLMQLEDWYKHTESPRMVVVDTLQKVRGVTSGHANIYALDYEVIGKLKKFADARRISVILVHHLNKGKDFTDPFDRINGSVGLMGAADATIMLERDRGSGTGKLTCTGRDIISEGMDLRFCAGRWSVVGRDVLEREAYNQNYIVRTVKQLLSTSFAGDTAVSSEELADDIVKYCGNTPFGTVTAVSKAVSVIAPKLLEYDNITTQGARVGTKRGFRFSQPRSNKEVY